jgi:hypothetical protein
MKGQNDRGSVTAETAVALPALVLVLCAVLWAVGAVTAQLRCVDAARAGARALARGEPPGASQAAAAAAAPRGAVVSMDRDGDMVRVRVESVARPPGMLLAGLASVRVRGEAVAAAEDTHAP